MQLRKTFTYFTPLNRDKYVEKELLDLIKASGLKKKFIAEKLSITDRYFSMCIGGSRKLSQKKEQQLIDLLKPAA